MYQFATNKENYEDYSSGRVLYSATGATNFPVRLSSEVFQRSISQLETLGNKGPYTIYDPFCGAAYSLTVIGFLHGSHLKSIYASDINGSVLEIAKRNLSLLSPDGLQERTEQLKTMFSDYKKESHKQALQSAERLKQQLPSNIQIQSFLLDAMNNENFPFPKRKIDLIITDLPYGKLTKWHGNKTADPSQQFLNKVAEILASNGIISISIDKKQAIAHEGYTKLKSFSIGKRKVFILNLNK